ncbi:hypothetical protein ACWEO4_14835 [Streptomyces sp. NPDC004393]|uniref:hypothetical protein n=1 Tax=unclassified Streptomyces TaxID=2593676 RepID=UPI0033B5FBA2
MESRRFVLRACDGTYGHAFAAVDAYQRRHNRHRPLPPRDQLPPDTRRGGALDDLHVDAEPGSVLDSPARSRP